MSTLLATYHLSLFNYCHCDHYFRVKQQICLHSKVATGIKKTSLQKDQEIIIKHYHSTMY